MPSPFPGMDPFFEGSRRWSDFHAAFINGICDELLRRLSLAYDARMNQQVQLVERAADEPHAMAGGVTVVASPVQNLAAPEAATGVGSAVMEPVTLPLSQMSQERRHLWIEIVTPEDERVVTVVEVLSPSNKRGDGLRQLAAKRRAAVLRGTNCVEIDLLLRGRRIGFAVPRPRSDYRAVVVRAERPTEADLYGWAIQSPLPTIPVPLLPDDRNATLDLKAAFDQTYDQKHYRRRLPYEREPAAAADPATLAWARRVLADAPA